ncbi:MAG: protein-disulfide reductase DsbD family protein [Alphaproteobacteria bacterium]|nr:protein-disulfide reductase DsbD family protein [Alphaproteobacteria bacterium]
MLRLLTLFLLAICAAPTAAHALAGDWQQDEAVKVRLISGIDGVGQEQIVPLGLEVQLADEWHTYWRSPGMAGLPPQIDWKESISDVGNLESAALLYPAPQRYSAYGLETIGYKSNVVFPIDAKLRTPGKALNIEASLDLLVCSAICVPKNFTLKLAIPEGEAKASTEAGLIEKFRDLIPGDTMKSGFILKSVTNDGESLSVGIESRNTLQAPDIFIENDKNIAFGAPITTMGEHKFSAQFKVKPADLLPESTKLSDLQLTLTIVDGDKALEQSIKAPPISAAPESSSASTISLGLVVLFALMGGLILNLMPCVLPVLSLKILSVVSHGGGDAKTVRHSFLMTAAGILFSFLVLAGLAMMLKELGMAVGWGVQFQQPMFLVFLILILTVFAANLWGLFEIHLPRFLADSLDKDYHPKMAGDFTTGAFATLLATPCTAPFLGTAVGFALASGPGIILLIFTMLGLGMAVPYLAIALFPRLAIALPKPGRWMMWLRWLLGVALAATAIWLVWILGAQIPWRFAVFVGLCMGGIVLLLGLKKTSASRRLVMIGLLDFAIVAVAMTLAGSLLPRETGNVERLWLPLNEKAIVASVDEGKVVFVDITADWCLTCKANKKFVLSRPDIAQRLFHGGIVAMQADWTNPDPVIAQFLQKYGRYGIPFNAVFGPGAPQGIILPELLTSTNVTEALEQAAKRP